MKKPKKSKTTPKQAVAILYFGASWCPPCHLMKKQVLPKLEALGFEVLQFDVDETQKAGKDASVKPLDDRYQIKAMPTIVFIEARHLKKVHAAHDGKADPQELGRVRGAEPLKLILAEIAKVEQYLANKKRLMPEKP